MKKIPTLFKRDYETGLVIPELNPKAEWVMQDAWPAHRKYDGTCVGLFLTVNGQVRINEGVGSDEITDRSQIGEKWMARQSVPGRMRFPDNFEPEEFDATTGKHVGWVPIEQSPFHKFLVEAETNLKDRCLGTYELCGPKINGNPENYRQHTLVHHWSSEQISNVQVLDIHEMSVQDAYVALKATLAYMPIEGVVWYGFTHGMAKLKRKDFGLNERL